MEYIALGDFAIDDVHAAAACARTPAARVPLGHLPCRRWYEALVPKQKYLNLTFLK